MSSTAVFDKLDLIGKYFVIPMFYVLTILFVFMAIILLVKYASDKIVKNIEDFKNDRRKRR